MGRRAGRRGQSQPTNRPTAAGLGLEGMLCRMNRWGRKEPPALDSASVGPTAGATVHGRTTGPAGDRASDDWDAGRAARAGSADEQAIRRRPWSGGHALPNQPLEVRSLQSLGFGAALACPHRMRIDSVEKLVSDGFQALCFSEMAISEWRDGETAVPARADWRCQKTNDELNRSAVGGASSLESDQAGRADYSDLRCAGS